MKHKLSSQILGSCRLYYSLKVNTSTEQGCTQVITVKTCIKSYSKDIYNVTKDLD